MHKHPHSSQFLRGFSLKENRFIFEVGSTGETTPDATPQVESGKEGIRNKEEDLKTAQVSLDAKIQNATSQVEDLPDAFKKQIKDNVAQFCEVSYDQIAIKDGVDNMSGTEHSEWFLGVNTRVEEVLSGITGSAEQAQADQDEKEKELKSLEEEISDLNDGVEDIEHEEFDLVEANLKNPDTLPGELEKYKNRAIVLQEKRVEMSGKMGEVMDVQKAYEAELNTGNVVAGVGAIVAVGAATAWIPGVNVLSLSAAAIAVAAAVAMKAAQYAREKEMAAKANAKVQTFKESYDEQRGEFAHVVRDMRKDGDKLHEAAPDLRGKIEGSRDAAAETLSESASETSEERAALQQRLEENTAARDRIAEQKQLVLDQQLALQDSRSTAEKNEEKVDANKHGLGNKLESVNSAILEIKNSGVLKGDNAEAKAKYDELLSARDIMSRGVEQMGLGKDQLKNFLVDTAELDPKMDEQFAMLQYSDETLVRTGEMLSLSEASLSERILRIEESLGVVETEAATKIEQVNELEGSVTSGVAEISIENIKAQTSVEMEWTTLKNMKVEAPAFLTSVANSVAAPFEKVFGGISYVLELGKDIPVLGSGLSFLSGVSEAAGDITGGLAKMAVLLPSALVGNEDGIAMAKGLGNVALLGTTEGSREAWVGMGKAIVAADMWEKDGAKAAGKAAANIAMFFIPGAGPGAGIARSTYAAARTAGAGVLRSATRAAVNGVKTTVVETGKSYGSMVKGAGRKVRGAARGIRSKLRRGKNAAAETSTEAGAAVESTAAATESTATRGSVLDDAGNVLDDAGNIIDESVRTPKQQAEGARGSMKKAREVRSSMHPDKFGDVSKNGILKDQQGAMKDFLSGKTQRIKIKDIDAEIARCNEYMNGIPAKDKMGQLGAHETMVNGLKQLRAQAKSIKSVRKQLTDGLSFKEGQKVKLVNNKTGEVFKGKYSIDPATGKVRIERFETGAGGNRLDVKYISPERLRNFRNTNSTSVAVEAAPVAEATVETVAASGRAPRTGWERYGPPSWRTRYRAFNRSRRGATATSEAAPVVEAEAVTASRPSLYSRASARVRGVRSRAREMWNNRPRTPRWNRAPKSSVASVSEAVAGPSLSYRAGATVRRTGLRAREMWNNRPRPIRRALDARNARRAERAAKNSRYADRLEKGRGARADNRVFLKESRANRRVSSEALEGLPTSSVETTMPVIDTATESASLGKAPRSMWSKYGPPSWRTRLRVGARNRATVRTERVAARTRKSAVKERVNRIRGARKERLAREATTAEVNATEVFINEELGYVRLDEMDKVIAGANADSAVAIYNRLDDVLHEMVPNRGANAVRSRIQQLRTRAGNRVPAEIAPEALQTTDKLLASEESIARMTNKQLKTEYKKLTDPDFEIEMRYMADAERGVAEMARDNVIAETNRRIQSGAMSEGRIVSRGVSSIETSASRAAMPSRLPKDFRNWTTEQLQKAFQERRLAQSKNIGSQSEQMYMGRDLGDIISQLNARKVAPIEPPIKGIGDAA